MDLSTTDNCRHDFSVVLFTVRQCMQAAPRRVNMAQGPFLIGSLDAVVLHKGD